jgi:hypothetical protein
MKMFSKDWLKKGKKKAFLEFKKRFIKHETLREIHSHIVRALTHPLVQINLNKYLFLFVNHKIKNNLITFSIKFIGLVAPF